MFSALSVRKAPSRNGKGALWIESLFHFVDAPSLVTDKE